jgi:hypothetical protein
VGRMPESTRRAGAGELTYRPAAAPG